MLQNRSLKEVVMYTDGACLGNPGRGGYGVVLLYGKFRKEISGGYRLTTNNRMELMAVISGLMQLKEPCRVTVYVDSQYVVNAVNKGWVKNWKKNGWKRSGNKKVANVDLWEKLLKLCERHEVSFVWLKGHDGDPHNERCDELSREAAMKNNLPEDPGFLGNVD
ncbi:MAG: ribonuclease HI [Syntrophales bacterium]|nr:ribonuclease HI [Syntrophales bacterium]